MAQYSANCRPTRFASFHRAVLRSSRTAATATRDGPSRVGQHLQVADLPTLDALRGLLRGGSHADVEVTDALGASTADRYGSSVLVQSLGGQSAIYEPPEGGEPDYELREVIEARPQITARPLAEFAIPVPPLVESVDERRFAGRA